MKKLDYKWVIVALCFLMTFITLGFCSSTKSLFIGPITEHLGIERGIFSINDSLRFIATAVINIFFGAFITRFGERKVIAAGFGVMIASMLAMPLLKTCGFCILMAINGVAVQHMKDVGIDSSLVATIWSVHSLCLAGFKFLTGFIYDKTGLRATVNICTVTAVIVMFTLGSVTNTTTGIIFAIIYSVFSGMALPLETIMLPIYAGDLFGEKSYAKILGLIVSFNTAGYAVGSPLMNLSYDVFGTYKYGLYFCGFLMIAVIVALQFVISAGNKARREISEKQ